MSGQSLSNDRWRRPASPEFLEELRERAARYGWSGDFVEIACFVKDLHAQAGVPMPEKYDVIEEPEEENNV